MAAAPNNLVRLQKFQIKPASEMLARAFQDYPLFSYFFPDASRREKKLYYGFEFLVRLGISYGEVYATSPILEGVTVWLPPNKAGITSWRAIRHGGLSLVFRLGIKSIMRKSSVGRFISSMHKRHAPFPHWYLAILGVDPRFQGKGYASNLLKPMLTRLDREHLPCYLETQNKNALSMYQHFGFQVVEEAIIPGTETST
jgi:ribosomal protein S18 acetylase RimI-like enzyme